MQPYTIECEDCGTRRLGRIKDGAVEPVQPACPSCGSEAFAVLSERRVDEGGNRAG